MSGAIHHAAQALKDGGLNEDWDVRVALARSVISAIRDVPMEIEAVGDNTLDSDCLMGCDGGVVWRAMIDAILAED